MAGLEVVACEQFLFAALAADSGLATIGIHAGMIPVDDPLPGVVYSWQGGTDLRGVGPTRIWANVLYLVKVVGAGRSLVALKTYLAAIDARLQAASGVQADGTVLVCVREGPFRQDEYTDGQHYTHAGGFYRLYAQ